MEQDSTGTGTTASLHRGGSLEEKVALFGPLDFADVLVMGADAAQGLTDYELRGDAHGHVGAAALIQGHDHSWTLVPAGDGPVDQIARAPELGPDESSNAGDVYALGTLLVFALTGHPFEPSPPAAAPGSTEPPVTAEAPATTEQLATDARSSSGDAPDDAGREIGEDRTLPEVMASFLGLLRRSLAADPTDRPLPGEMSVTLRRLHAEAQEAALGVPVDATVAPLAPDATQIVMIDAQGRLITAQGHVIGTAHGVGGPKGPRRLPVLITAVAIIAVLAMGIAFARKGEQVATAPVTSATTSTTLPATTTAAPVVTEPPTTLPAGLVAVTIDMSRNSSCKGCSVALRPLPFTAEKQVASYPDKTELWAKCWSKGDSLHDDLGFTSDQWLFIAGPSSITGWVPIVYVGRQNYGLPGCPQAPAPAPTTTEPPPTTAAPTTPPPTTPPPTTAAPTTTTTHPSTSTTLPTSPPPPGP